jgi:hypothetical protein
VIAFGRGELPQEPDPPPPLSDEGYSSFWACSLHRPSSGGTYTALEVRRSSERLTFDIKPAEIWTDQCGDDLSACQPCFLCEEQLGFRYRIDLAIVGDELQGTLDTAAFGTRSELRLKRVQ